MNHNSIIIVENNIVIEHKEYLGFWNCYYPFIKEKATILYLRLLHLSSNELTLLQLMNGLNFAKHELIEAKEVLQKFNLLKCYKHKNNDTYLFSCVKPLSMQAFLQHDVLGRYFMLKKGRNVYEQYLKESEQAKTVSDEYEEEVVLMQELFETDYSINHELQFNYVSNNHLSRKTNFPINDFLTNTPLAIFPSSARTNEVIDLICEMGDLYHISSEQMRLLVSKSCGLNNGKFRKEEFKRRCRNTTNVIIKEAKSNYDMDPLSFLGNYQQGVPLANSDKKIIEKLIVEYKLSKELTNVIIEYTLTKCNNQLNHYFIEKVATSLIRSHIDSVEEAKRYFEAYENAKKKNKPKYYRPKQEFIPINEDPQYQNHQENDDFDEDAYNEMMQRLRGE